MRIPKSSITKIATLLLVLTQIAGLAGCSLPLMRPAATLTPSTTPFPPTQTPIPTYTLTPTPIPTRTATPTLTATLVPTATPPGFFSKTSAGFSLIFNKFWEKEEEGSNYLTLSNESYRILFTLWSRAEESGYTLDDAVQDVQNSLGDGVTFDRTHKGSLKLGGDLSMPYQDFRVQNGGDAFEMRVGYLIKKGRGYGIQVFAPLHSMTNHSKELDALFTSIQLGTANLYDLPHDQTLVQLGGDPDAKDLDPALTATSAADYVGLLFSGLVRMTPQMQVAPDLAKSWTVSPDGLVYTFTLQPDLKFASGDPLTAQKVKDSWERACDPKTGSTTAGIYLGDILGVKDRLEKKADSIRGVKVIDDQTLEVTVDGAKPYFLAKLTYPTAAVYKVSDASWGESWALKADATGPYMVKKNIPDDALIFERNPNSPLKPSIQYLVFMRSPGGSPVSLYEEGVIDLLPLNLETFNRVNKPDDPLHGQLVTTPSLCTDMLQLNPGRAPTDDLNVRKALALATDKNLLRDKLGGELTLLASGVLPPAMPGYQAGLPDLGYDPAAAKAALQASKYAGNLPPVTLVASGYGDSQSPAVTALADMWQKNLGISVKVVYVNPSDPVTAERSANGNVNLFSWCADYPDPENFLDVLFHSSSNFNIGMVNDPQLDELLVKARTERDGALRLQLYQQAEKLVLENGYSVPYLNDLFAVLAKPRVKGFVLPPMHVGVIPWLSLGPE